MRSSFLFLLFFCATLIALPASAQQVLYENGPINGHTDAWTINFGFEVDDSFFLSRASQVTGISFGAWLMPGDVLESAEVSITSQPGYGATFFDGVVNFTQSGCFLNEYSFNVCTETGNFSAVNLIEGTYYLNLFNAVTAEGNPVYWDENSGVGCHSPGCPSIAFPDFFETIPSEAFTVLGNNGSGGTVPEPGSLALFATGVVGAFGWVSNRLRKAK